MILQIINKHIVFFSLLFFGIGLTAQDYSTKIEGRVYSKDGDVASTHILNISLQRFTIADADGFFSIPVRENDTLVFSGIQFKKKQVIITNQYLKQKTILFFLEEVLTQLDEVVVTPYNLTGKLDRDMNNLKIGPIVTSSTEDLPNAHIKHPTKSQRKLYAARTWDYRIVAVRLDPLINYFSGRTKMLKNRVARETQRDLIGNVGRFYKDSSYVHDLKIPQKNIKDFIFFCETDFRFNTIVKTNDKLNIWEFLRKKSPLYRENNALD